MVSELSERLCCDTPENTVMIKKPEKKKKKVEWLSIVT
jgi:hypothetical protein